MKSLFWVLFASESLFMIWMLWDEMKIKYLPTPAYIPLGFLWLILTLVIKLIIKSDKIAFIMVGIPAIPLLFMVFFAIIIFIVNLVSGPIRWN